MLPWFQPVPNQADIKYQKALLFAFNGNQHGEVILAAMAAQGYSLFGVTQYADNQLSAIAMRSNVTKRF